MKTSVVIPAWNGKAYLQENLPAVMAIGADEVIVVDDCSTDNTGEFLKKDYPQIIVVNHLRNTRFPQAVNDGFKAATGDLVVLLNQDVKPNKDLLKSCLEHFQDQEIFAVTFNEQVRSWAKASFNNGFIEFTNGKIDSKIHNSFWASGGSAVFRKSMWVTLGGFWREFAPGYYEDLDIGYRAWKRGWKVVWEPKAIVKHEWESTHKQLFDAKYLTRIKDRNYLLVHWRNLGWRNLFWHKMYLIKRLALTPGYVIPVVMALRYLPEVLSFRLSERNFTTLKDDQIFSKFS